MMKKNLHWGTTLDEFLGAEGIREAVKAEAVTRAIAWQLKREMERRWPHGRSEGPVDISRTNRP